MERTFSEDALNLVNSIGDEIVVYNRIKEKDSEAAVLAARLTIKLMNDLYLIDEKAYYVTVFQSLSEFHEMIDLCK